MLEFISSTDGKIEITQKVKEEYDNNKKNLYL